jgi:flagellar biosynthesis GTPase FlhF
MHVHLGTREKDGTVVSISESVRRKHALLLGKTGVGKTTSLFKHGVLRSSEDILRMK